MDIYEIYSLFFQSLLENCLFLESMVFKENKKKPLNIRGVALCLMTLSCCIFSFSLGIPVGHRTGYQLQTYCRTILASIPYSVGIIN